MAARPMDQACATGIAAVATDGGDRFCPECGQSLHLSRQRADAAPGRPVGRWVVAIVGLALVVHFGVRGWQGLDALAGLDRQIRDVRAATTAGVLGTPSNQEMLRLDALQSLAAERLLRRQGVDRSVVGIELGVAAILVGLGAVARRRGDDHSGRPSSGEGSEAPGGVRGGLRAAMRGARACGENALAALVWPVLAAFGYACAAQLIAVPLPSWELVGGAADRALDAVVAAVAAATRCFVAHVA